MVIRFHSHKTSPRAMAATVEQLRQACWEGKVDEAKRLLDEGVDPYAKDSFGETLAHYAANNGKVDCLQLLLDRGADPSATNKKGKTPMDLLSADKRSQIKVPARAAQPRAAAASGGGGAQPAVSDGAVAAPTRPPAAAEDEPSS